MELTTLLVTINRNIIIKQHQIDKVCDEISYHNKMISNHYNFPIETMIRYNYLLECLNKLRLEQRAYKFGRNVLLKKECNYEQVFKDFIN